MGQILSDEGNQEEAINSLIDALKWNPKNEWALLMMGNIFSKYHKDLKTALLYYNQALENKPDDIITMVNIGVNLFQTGNTEKAKSFINQALELNPTYPNAHMALVIMAEKVQDWELVFSKAIQTLKLCQQKDDIYKNALKFLIDSAEKLVAKTSFTYQILQYKGELETQCDKNIELKESEKIVTPAKIEFAENYQRNHHIVNYKPNYTAHEHLIMHELVHLDFVIDARKENANQLYTTNASCKQSFLQKFQNNIVKKLPKNLPLENINQFIDSLFDGLNARIYNAPIDLFIEDFLFNNYKELRPFQLLSQMRIIEESINAVTHKEILAIVPSEIVSATKIYNYVMALQFKEMFGIDILERYQTKLYEKNQAKVFYEEYEEYKDDKQAAEEYELVQHWAEDLKLDTYFELVYEDEHRRKTIEDIVSEIENDPYGLETPNPAKERKMRKFLESHTSAEINQAVAMYMVGAIEFFKKMAKPKVKELAFEFATLGMGGIDPEKNGYSIPSIKSKVFTGYQALAYYYVSWAIAIPEMLARLQMPFDKEYELAKQLVEL
jgi:hypothetical protein